MDRGGLGQLGKQGRDWVCPNPQGAGLGLRAAEEEEEGGVGTGQAERGSGEQGWGGWGAPLRPWG